jgi:hypothetical protein
MAAVCIASSHRWNCFLEHTFYWHGECFSVDVTYGIELRKKGYTNMIDWTVITGHTDQHGNVLYPNDNCTVAAYEKQRMTNGNFNHSKRAMCRE